MIKFYILLFLGNRTFARKLFDRTSVFCGSSGPRGWEVMRRHQDNSLQRNYTGVLPGRDARKVPQKNGLIGEQASKTWLMELRKFERQ